MADRHPEQLNTPSGLSRRQLLTGALQGSVLMLLGPMELAHGAQLLAVRVWPASDYTRVTLESDTPLQAKHFLIANPHRLVVDIEGLTLSAQLKELVSKVQPDDPFIAGVRVGQFKANVVRLVFDLKQAVAPQVFTLQPVAAYQHRLVFDLYPSTAPDPNKALQTPPYAPAPLPSAPSSPPSAASATPASAAPGPVSLDDMVDKKRSAQAAADMNDALGDFIGDLKRHTDDKVAMRAPVSKNSPGDKSKARTDKSALPAESVVADKSASTPDDKDSSGMASRNGTQRLVIIALDPGHGGEDPGAVGPSNLYEKDVVLSVARMLRARINAQPGMRAMLTRESDYFVPLHERVNKARRVQADLFVSIHADAFMNQQAHGASVFALSENGATSAAARWMAKKENASDMVGGVNIKAKDATVMRALLDMSTTAQIKDSLKLGSAILGHLGKIGKLHKGAVEQAGFAVLKAPDIPSVLVETGFISNPEEESKLRDPDYQGELADALMSGIQRYFAKNPPIARNRAL
ncbi:N-acetylmuramoyl-L-alanine amidase [Aquabacterium sp.]|uniref:N-acetylmuramoyl-L-alanine amidase n=1 Tax=Aquabacterium sp. TaxID=1872578 RepID=UPI0035B34D94